MAPLYRVRGDKEPLSPRKKTTESRPLPRWDSRPRDAPADILPRVVAHPFWRGFCANPPRPICVQVCTSTHTHRVRRTGTCAQQYSSIAAVTALAAQDPSPPPSPLSPLSSPPAVIALARTLARFHCYCSRCTYPLHQLPLCAPLSPPPPVHGDRSPAQGVASRQRRRTPTAGARHSRTPVQFIQNLHIFLCAGYRCPPPPPCSLFSLLWLPCGRYRYLLQAPVFPLDEIRTRTQYLRVDSPNTTCTALQHGRRTCKALPIRPRPPWPRRRPSLSSLFLAASCSSAPAPARAAMDGSCCLLLLLLPAAQRHSTPSFFPLRERSS